MIVRESIDFQRYGDPKASMGIGRRELIEIWIEEMRKINIIRVPQITRNYSIDAGEVDLSDTLFEEFPDYIKFGHINMDFKCFVKSAKAMRAFPDYVGREMTVYYPSNLEKPFEDKHVRMVTEVNGYVVVIPQDE